jgi:ferredoxin
VSRNGIRLALKRPEGRIVKVRVDPQRCQGHTLCAMIAPDMFTLSDLDGSSSAVCETVPASQEELVREAAHSCPEQAIRIEESQNGASDVSVDHEKTRETMP